jgi:predicted component of type VI protein secretion system
MPLTLDVIAGPGFGRQFSLESGMARCGRGSEATWHIGSDPGLAPVHFTVRHYASKYYLIRVTDAALLLNAQEVDQTPLVSGDRIQAGQSVFLVRVTGQHGDGRAPAAPVAAARGTAASVRSSLDTRQDQIYALIDAARKPANVVLLRESGDSHASLYSGSAAQELVNVAPYLVHLRGDSPVLEALVEEGWNDAWGYCIVSSSSFDELRIHLRKFLMVTLDDGREAYFRFYDPRVLRAFLPVSTPEQASRFFEKIEEVLCPGEAEFSVTSFRFEGGRVAIKELAPDSGAIAPTDA